MPQIKLPRIIITQGAAQGLERCKKFLPKKNPAAAIRAAQAISQQLHLISHQPNSGRQLDSTPELRELIIPFGDSGYIALCRFDEETDVIYVLAFKHQKEAGY